MVKGYHKVFSQPKVELSRSKPDLATKSGHP